MGYNGGVPPLELWPLHPEDEVSLYRLRRRLIEQTPDPYLLITRLTVALERLSTAVDLLEHKVARIERALTKAPPAHARQHRPTARR